jgi:hypothetical protein
LGFSNVIGSSVRERYRFQDDRTNIVPWIVGTVGHAFEDCSHVRIERLPNCPRQCLGGASGMAKLRLLFALVVLPQALEPPNVPFEIFIYSAFKPLCYCSQRTKWGLLRVAYQATFTKTFEPYQHLGADSHER